MLIRGDARRLPIGAACVDCVVTSPPYYGLRDYGTAHWRGGDPACLHGPRVMGNANKGNVREVLDGDRSRCYRCGAERVDRQLGQHAKRADGKSGLRFMRAIGRGLDDGNRKM